MKKRESIKFIIHSYYGCG